MLATCSKSFKVLILLVAWRWSASSMSSEWMPLPLSLTRIRRIPPPASSTSIAVAPASILFSTISFRALAGRSTTSPAAIWLTRWSGSAAIRDIGFFQKKATAEGKITGICASIRIRRGRFCSAATRQYRAIHND